MARIDRPPHPGNKNLRPCAEVHRCGVTRHSNIAQVSIDIAGGDIEAAAQRNKEAALYLASLYFAVLRLSASARRADPRWWREVPVAGAGPWALRSFNSQVSALLPSRSRA
jgi:hypothetical protein